MIWLIGPHGILWFLEFGEAGEAALDILSDDDRAAVLVHVDGGKIEGIELLPLCATEAALLTALQPAAHPRNISTVEELSRRARSRGYTGNDL